MKNFRAPPLSCRSTCSFLNLHFSVLPLPEDRSADKTAALEDRQVPWLKDRPCGS
jgi:hypothetical protein